MRNIPNKYQQQMLLEEINNSHEGTYDFFYLPIDFKNKCNVGYCFINFLDPKHIVAFVKEFNGLRWKSFNSEKVCAITFARIQGKGSMVSRFQNSSLLEKDDEYRPLLFFSSGPDRGKPEPFPSSSRSMSIAPYPPGGGVGNSKHVQGPYTQQQVVPPTQHVSIETASASGDGMTFNNSATAGSGPVLEDEVTDITTEEGEGEGESSSSATMSDKVVANKMESDSLKAEMHQ